MATQRSSIPVVIAMFAVVSVGYAMSNASSHNDARKLQIHQFPFGQNSPEGAACDYMRAFIKDDHRLFHERRIKVGCEGWADPGIAYQHFRAFEPLQDDSANHHGRRSNQRPMRIEKVFSARKLGLVGTDRISLMLNYGALESRFVEIITSANDGTRFLSRIQVMQSGDWSQGSQDPIATGIWHARFASNKWFDKAPAEVTGFSAR